MIHCCCNPFTSGPCRCTIPRVITFLGSNQGNGNQVFPTLRGFGVVMPVTLTYQTRPAQLGPTLPFYNVNASITRVTMPARSWFSPQLTATGDTPWQIIFWAFFGTCSLVCRLLTFDNVYGHPAANEWGIDGTGSASATLVRNGSPVTGNTCIPFALNNLSVQSFQQVVPGGASPGPAFGGTHGDDDVPTDDRGNAGTAP